MFIYVRKIFDVMLKRAWIMRNKICLTVLLVSLVLVAACAPKLQPIPEVPTVTGETQPKAERDDFGCFSSCSYFPEGSKHMCEDWKVGKQVQWPPDCKLMQYGPCIKLCEAEKKNSPQDSQNFPDNNSQQQDSNSFNPNQTSQQTTAKDDFGCFYSCSYFSESSKQMCENWKAGKLVVWPEDCSKMQYGPCIKLCEFELKYNLIPETAGTGIPETDPNAENVYIYVLDVDPLNHRIVRIDDMTGKGVVSYGSRGSGVNQFDVKDLSPHFAVDSKGRIYIPDSWNHRVIRVDDMQGNGWVTYGEPATSNELVGKFTGPNAVRLDSKERIYVLDQGYNQVVRFDDMTGKNWVAFGKKGTNIKDWPQNSVAHCDTGPAPGTYHDDAAVNVFYSPKALEVDSQGRIYVSDKCNYRIVRFDDMTGKNWVSFGGKRGSGMGEFGDELNGIAVGPDGKIYIADEHNHRIVRIDDMTGKGWTVFGSQGGGVNQFHQPHDIAISKSGKIYITDTFHNDRIVRFDDMTGKNWITYAPYINAPPGANKLHLDVPKGIFIVEKE